MNKSKFFIIKCNKSDLINNTRIVFNKSKSAYRLHHENIIDFEDYFDYYFSCYFETIYYETNIENFISIKIKERKKMITVSGKYNYAHIMLDEVEENVKEQIITFLDSPVFKKSKIRIMPDCHVGSGSCIGFTATLGEHIIPAIVGVDISCGVETYCLGNIEIDFQKFDQFIRENIPCGFNIRKNPARELSNHHEDLIREIYNVCDKTDQDFNKVKLSLGTLGGGNHLEELNLDNKGNVWFTVHTGSRNFGLKIANFYQNKAKELMKKFFIETPRDLEFLPMEYGGEEYLKDMEVAQKYAELNRHIIAKEVVENFFSKRIEDVKSIKSVHNYIDLKNRIIRKGAISAYEGEEVVIPLNMRDGIILGTGKGNKEYNYSAPHGAGRVLGRNQAKKELDIKDFENSMKGIWSSCISEKTLDESPMVYKNKDLIIFSISEVVDIIDIAKPIYNFKAAE